MKYILLLFIIVSPLLSLSQKAFERVYYIGKIGDTSISFFLSYGYPGGEQLITTTKSKRTVYIPCDEKNNVGEIRMCHSDQASKITVNVDREAQTIPDKVVIMFDKKRKITLFRTK